MYQYLIVSMCQIWHLDIQTLSNIDGYWQILTAIDRYIKPVKHVKWIKVHCIVFRMFLDGIFVSGFTMVPLCTALCTPCLSAPNEGGGNSQQHGPNLRIESTPRWRSEALLSRWSRWPSSKLISKKVPGKWMGCPEIVHPRCGDIDSGWAGQERIASVGMAAWRHGRA